VLGIRTVQAGQSPHGSVVTPRMVMIGPDGQRWWLAGVRIGAKVRCQRVRARLKLSGHNFPGGLRYDDRVVEK